MGFTMQKPFDRVSVLLFSFSALNFDVSTNEARLMRIFKEVYNFEVERVQFDVPGLFKYEGNPFWEGDKDDELDTRIRDLLFDFVRDRSGPDALCIFVYSGHAEIRGEVPHFRLFQRTRTILDPCLPYDLPPGRMIQVPHDPYVDWFRFCHPAMGLCPGRSLTILNTCYITGIGQKDREFEPEVLAVCGWNGEATADNANMFSKSLADILEELDGARCSVSAIHAKIQQRMPVTPVYFPGRDERKPQETIVLQKLTPRHESLTTSLARGSD